MEPVHFLYRLKAIPVFDNFIHVRIHQLVMDPWQLDSEDDMSLIFYEKEMSESSSFTSTAYMTSWKAEHALPMMGWYDGGSFGRRQTIDSASIRGVLPNRP
jgi:hypothetical protein